MAIPEREHRERLGKGKSTDGGIMRFASLLTMAWR